MFSLPASHFICLFDLFSCWCGLLQTVYLLNIVGTMPCGNLLIQESVFTICLVSKCSEHTCKFLMDMDSLSARQKKALHLFLSLSFFRVIFLCRDGAKLNIGLPVIPILLSKWVCIPLSLSLVLIISFQTILHKEFETSLLSNFLWQPTMVQNHAMHSRIWGKLSAIPSFRMWGNFWPFHHSTRTVFRVIWLQFHVSDCSFMYHLVLQV